MTHIWAEEATDSGWARFVVLNHSVGSGMNRTIENHFDWMFERTSDAGSDLMTLSTHGIPCLERTNLTLDAVRLADHRRVYLDIVEQNLSNDRGRVVRVAGGHYRVVEDTDERFRVLCRVSLEKTALPPFQLGVEFALRGGIRNETKR